MKAIKIGLAIIVIGAIAFFVFRSNVTKTVVGVVQPIENQSFVKGVQNKIDSIDALPNYKFDKHIYDSIKYYIDDYSKPQPPKYPYGRLGETQLENDQQVDILTRNLYSAYVAKFLDQAFFVFINTMWEPADLSFMRTECQLLRSSAYLESGSLVDKRLGDIQNIFNKLDEINRFIYENNNYQFPSPDSSVRVNILDIRKTINRCDAYRQNVLSNRYLRNNRYLLVRLNGVPNSIFQNHVKYLDKRINAWSNLYNIVESQIVYRNTLYDPIKTDIEEIDSGLYRNTISTLDDERTRLLSRWNVDASNAYNYFNQLKNAREGN